MMRLNLSFALILIALGLLLNGIGLQANGNQSEEPKQRSALPAKQQSSEPPSSRVKEDGQPKKERDKTQQAPDAPSEPPVIVNQPATNTEKQAPATKPQQSFKDGFAPSTWASWGQIIVGGLGLVVIWLTLLAVKNQAKSTEEAAIAGMKSVEVAEKTLVASQRAWVSVRFHIGSELKFTGEGGRITIIFIVKNIGNAPAVGTWIEAAITLLTPKRDILVEAKKVCPDRPRLQPGQPVTGFSLFPNEELSMSISLDISQADIDQAGREFVEVHKDYPAVEKDTSIAPVLVGCVKYTLPIDGSSHKTTFIANLSRVDPKHADIRFAIDPALGDVPVDLLKLDPLFYGGLAD